MKRWWLLSIVLLIAGGLMMWSIACGEGGGDDDDTYDDDTDDDVDDDVDDDADDDADDDTDDDIDDDTDDDIDDDTDDDTGEGNAVQLNDPTEAAVLQMYWLPGSSQFDQPFEAEWDWYWVSGNGMSVQFPKQSGTPDWVAAIDFYSVGGAHIEAFDKQDGWVTCVPSVNYEQWYHFKVTFDPSAKKYSVYVNGNPTSCTNLDYNVSLLGKIQGIRMQAYSDVNGGQTILDNLILTRGGVPFFSEDFEDDTPGSPPGSPWTISADGGASATVIALP